LLLLLLMMVAIAVHQRMDCLASCSKRSSHRGACNSISVAFRWKTLVSMDLSDCCWLIVVRFVVSSDPNRWYAPRWLIGGWSRSVFLSFRCFVAVFDCFVAVFDQSTLGCHSSVDWKRLLLSSYTNYDEL
jgi:hypothetical protein